MNKGIFTAHVSCLKNTNHPQGAKVDQSFKIFYSFLPKT